jgi:hypothetical protein
VAPRDLIGNGQPQSPGAAPIGAALEGAHQSLPVVDRNAGPVIVNDELQLTVGALQADLDARRSVSARVAQQVVEQTGE